MTEKLQEKSEQQNTDLLHQMQEFIWKKWLDVPTGELKNTEKIFKLKPGALHILGKELQDLDWKYFWYEYICTATPEQESADRFADLREMSLLRKMKQTGAPSLIEYPSFEVYSPKYVTVSSP